MCINYANIMIGDRNVHKFVGNYLGGNFVKKKIFFPFFDYFGGWCVTFSFLCRSYALTATLFIITFITQRDILFALF